jgi:hypothetical protein
MSVKKNPYRKSRLAVVSSNMMLSEPCLQGGSEFTERIQVKESRRSKCKDDFAKDSCNNPQNSRKQEDCVSAEYYGT